MKTEETDRRFRRQETAEFMDIFNSLSNPFMTKAIAFVTYEEAERIYSAKYGSRRFSNYQTFLTSRARFIKKRIKNTR